MDLIRPLDESEAWNQIGPGRFQGGGSAHGGLMPLQEGLRAVNERGLEGFVDNSGSFRFLRTPQAGRVVANHQLGSEIGTGRAGGRTGERILQPVVVELDGRVIYEAVVAQGELR